MARSRSDTLVYATILLAPLATALVYMTTRPGPETIVVTAPAPAPTPATDEPPTPVIPAPEVTAPEVAAPAVIAPEVAAPAVIAPEVAAPGATAPEVAAPVDTAPEVAASEPVPGASMLVYDGKLVLSTAAQSAWARGRLQFDDLDEPSQVIAWKSVAPARLPAPLRPLAGAAVLVYAADGSTCAATVGPLTVYGRESGDLLPLEDGQSEPTRAQLAAVREQVFTDATLLLGELDGACDGLWARRADLSAPAVFAAAALAAADEATLREQVRAALTHHPDVLAMQAEYTAFVARQDPADPPRPWPAYLEHTLGLQRFTEVGGARSLLNVQLGDGGEPCGDYFTTELGLLFALVDGRIEPLGAGFLGPQVIVDLERDGAFAAVTDGGRALAGDAFSFPIHGCPC